MKIVKLLTLFTLFAVGNLYADNMQYTEEEYTINEGDTLSDVLYSKGVHGVALLYGAEGNDGVVSENKDLNPQINNWNALRPSTVIKLKYPSSMETADVQENYIVQEGDTLSEVLYSKGTKGLETLYGKDGYVEKNEKLNPEVSNWEKLTPGTHIKLVYKKPSSSSSTATVKNESESIDVEIADVNKEDLKTAEAKTEVVEIKEVKEDEVKKVETSSDYFLEHRFLLGLGIGYNKETQTTQTIKSSGAITFPVLQYQLYYRPVSDPDVSTWDYRFLAEINKGLSTRGVSIPFGGQIEFGFGRYSLFKFGTTRFNPNVDLNFSVGQTVTSDTSNNLSARQRNTLWLGFKPEFVSYIGSTMIEYYPFVYKSLYMKSMNERFSGWKFGLKTNVGIAFNNDLFGSFEYNYERHENQTPTVVLKLHEIILGVGYRF